MNALLLAATLAIRTAVPVDGTAACRPEPGETAVAAYTMEVDPVWSHGIHETKVDRPEALRGGAVTNLPPSGRLVAAFVSGEEEFDASAPICGDKAAYPYSLELADAYHRISGRDYVADMMSVCAPMLGSGLERSQIVRNMFRAIASVRPGTYSERRAFGPEDGEGIVILFGRFRTLDWQDTRAYGDDGKAYALRLGKAGRHVDLIPSSAMDALSVDDDGWFVMNGRRVSTLVIRHLSGEDARLYADLFKGRRTKTRVLAYDSPTICGSTAVFEDADL